METCMGEFTHIAFCFRESVSKIEAGQLQIEKKNFSLNDVLKTVESNAKGILSRTTHNIDIRHPLSPLCMFEQDNSQNGMRPLFYPGATDMIVGDPNRLQQVCSLCMP